jgi:hypothetical protein
MEKLKDSKSFVLSVEAIWYLYWSPNSSVLIFNFKKWNYILLTGNFKLDGGAMFGAQNNLEQNQSGRWK